MSLKIKNLTCTINQQIVLNNITLDIQLGKTTSIIGPSGAGKSSLLKCIAGIQAYNGSITGAKESGNEVGWVEQQYNLFPHLSVFDNIAYPLRIRHIKSAEIKQRVTTILQRFQLPSALTLRYPHELSGGEQQRVALARAFIYQPTVMLLDEPFGALDALLRYDLLHWLKTELASRTVTTLFVTHDLAEAEFISDTVMMLDHAQVQAYGTWSTVKQSANALVQNLLHKRLP